VASTDQSVEFTKLSITLDISNTCSGPCSYLAENGIVLVVFVMRTNFKLTF